MGGWLKRLVPMFGILLVPALVMAQSAATGTISGVTRDSSGAVLPGVTVEAASPALIEKVRTAVTDSQGVYRIIDLRPGMYTVTFTLPGFRTFRREGVELTTGFTATVNGDLAVGQLEETVTVTGAAPLVDTQNVSEQRVFTREVTESLPLGSSIKAYAALLPGATYGAGAQQQDVGGSTTEFQQEFAIHGGRTADFQQLRDGMYFGTLVAPGNWMTSVNPATVAESNIQVSSAGAELESAGVLINIVPRDGGNVFGGTINATGTTRSLQSDNLDDALKARGLTTAPYMRRRYDVGGGLGGPIRRDKVWFFVSLRSWETSSFFPGNYYNKTPTTLFYEPDFSRPSFDAHHYRDVRVRTTWQATSKDKIVASFGDEWNCNCPTLPFVFSSPETFKGYNYRPNWQAQVAWNRPATNRLLLEAGTIVVNGRFNSIQFNPPGAKQYVLDTSRNYAYGGPYLNLNISGADGYNGFGQTNQKFSVSYVSGSHAFKSGVQYLYGWTNNFYFHDPAVANYTSYIFNGTVPTAVTFFAGPTGNEGRQNKIGFFAQDQWTIDRLTLNLGVRYDGFKGRSLPIDLPAGPWVPARSFAAVKDIPNWKDWTPRLGAAFNVFGDGRTAIKASVGRYILFENMGIVSSNTPSNLLVTQANRAWTDANGDYVPQESELGPLSNANFGKVVQSTRYSDKVLHDNRPYNWQAAVQVQQELWSGAAVNVGYFRRWYGNFRALVNEAVSASDFTRYCVTAPSNPQLPGGGGQQICGFYDVSPAKFGQTSNLLTLASDFGKPSEVFNGLDVTLTSRFGGGGFLQIGTATGVSTIDTCYQNNLPNITQASTTTAASAGSAAGIISARNSDYCHVNPPWGPSTQFKAAVVYPLIWGLQASANYQNIGPISTPATATFTNAGIAPSLGRDLAACGSRTGAACTAAVVGDVVLPNTYYREPRAQQLDFRFSRTFTLAKGIRIQPQIDMFNVTNQNSVLQMVAAVGPRWQNAITVREPRVIRFGVDMNF